MGIINLPDGVGGTTGAALATAKPLALNSGATTNVWYVDSVTGTNGSSPAGQNRLDPLATLAQAVTNAAAGDIVVLLSTHAETLTAAVTINKNLTVIGEGSASGVPTAAFTNNHSGISFDVTGAHVELQNIKFPQSLQTPTGHIVAVSSSTTFIARGLYFEAGGFNESQCLELNGTFAELTSCTFISVATSNSDQPTGAISVGGAITLLKMDGCVLSNGTVGWSVTHAIDLTGAAVTQLKVTGQSLLLGGSMKALEATLGYVNVQTSTGGGRVDWADVT